METKRVVIADSDWDVTDPSENRRCKRKGHKWYPYFIPNSYNEFDICKRWNCMAVRRRERDCGCS